jgi:CheY-like chemotaxis protein
VDDDGDVLHVVAEVLRADADVVSVCSVEQARQVLSSGDVDIALIDLSLADGGGLDLLAALRSSGGRIIPAVVFSGRELEPDIAGLVDAVLTKSHASLDRLRGIVRRLAQPSVCLTNADHVEPEALCREVA